MTSKNNKAPLLYYIKLCASFQIHQWNKTWVTVRKRSIRVKIGKFLTRVTLKIDGWSRRSQIWGIWKLRPAYSPETPNLGQNRWCFVRCDLEICNWPLKTIGHLSFAVSSFVQHFIAIGEFKLELQSGNTKSRSKSTIFLAVWPWNLTDDLHNNRAPLLCYFKLCAAFLSHWWIQTGVTVRKRPIWVKIDDFFSRVTLKFDVWPWKTIGHLS